MTDDQAVISGRIESTPCLVYHWDVLERYAGFEREGRDDYGTLGDESGEGVDNGARWGFMAIWCRGMG
jgi:hypothetical protein